jgi:hypothetical protein
MGSAPEGLSAGTRRGAGKGGIAQRFRSMADDQKRLLLILGAATARTYPRRSNAH